MVCQVFERDGDLSKQLIVVLLQVENVIDLINRDNPQSKSNRTNTIPGTRPLNGLIEALWFKMKTMAQKHLKVSR